MDSKYAIVLDEALCSHDSVDLSVCDRAPSTNSPHRHYVVIQLEVENGAIKNAVANPGLHQKEIVEITKQFAKAGVLSYLPENVDARVRNDGEAKRVTLTRETVGANNSDVCHFFVDLRNEKGHTVRLLQEEEDTPDAYQKCRATLLAKATEFNLPFKDLVEEEIFKAGN